jgi:hypothetical protein
MGNLIPTYRGNVVSYSKVDNTAVLNLGSTDYPPWMKKKDNLFYKTLNEI